MKFEIEKWMRGKGGVILIPPFPPIQENKGWSEILSTFCFQLNIKIKIILYLLAPKDSASMKTMNTSYSCYNQRLINTSWSKRSSTCKHVIYIIIIIFSYNVKLNKFEIENEWGERWGNTNTPLSPHSRE